MKQIDMKSLEGQPAVVLSGLSIGRSVRDGCSLSPLLHLTYDEAVVIEATYSIQLVI